MIGDVTPDQVRLKQFSSSSTQTETDELSVKAQYIIENFNIIKAYWRKREITSVAIFACSVGILISVIAQKI